MIIGRCGEYGLNHRKPGGDYQTPHKPQGFPILTLSKPRGIPGNSVIADHIEMDATPCKTSTLLPMPAEVRLCGLGKLATFSLIIHFLIIVIFSLKKTPPNSKINLTFDAQIVSFK